MSLQPPKPPRPSQRHVRLDTLVRLRWYAVGGQAVAVLFVHYVLDFKLPTVQCGIVIAAAAWLNLSLRLQFPPAQRLVPEWAALLLAFDIAELTALLFFTGGLENPFAFLLLAPVLISATALPRRMTLPLGGFAMMCATFVMVWHDPLPWGIDDVPNFPNLYRLGDWIAMLLAIGFIGLYTWQVAEEERQLSDALTAAELALAHEQHLSALDGLAAAAAHELGTPLATIAVVVKELERSLEPNSRHADDVRLLREQSQRCREILAKITELSTSTEPFDRLKLSGLIEEVVAPHRHFGVDIDVVMPPDRAQEPVGTRSPAILYGLGNLLENAVDFARGRVEVAARWTGQQVAITIADDGPGFSPEVAARIGEPYVTTRGGDNARGVDDAAGLGLGFFIAKTLLERGGATLDVTNRTAPDNGAVVQVRWDRSDFEARLEGTT